MLTNKKRKISGNVGIGVLGKNKHKINLTVEKARGEKLKNFRAKGV